MKDKVGIKTDYDNRLRVIGEMISGDMDGLVAVLGNGLFVVTKEAYEALIELGIEMQVKKIHGGKPQSSKQVARCVPFVPLVRGPHGVSEEVLKKARELKADADHARRLYEDYLAEVQTSNQTRPEASFGTPSPRKTA